MRQNVDADGDWRHSAACGSNHPELFFPIGSGAPAKAQVEQARQVCHGCQVRSACLDWALKTGADHGVWGGLSEDERRALLRKRRRAAQAQHRSL